MMRRHHRSVLLLACLLLVVGGSSIYLWLSFPQLWMQSKRWQMELSRYISELLSLASQHPAKAMWTTFLASLSYGVLHAVGPGHGKVIMASYLSTHPAKLKTSLKLSLSAAMLQALVAITLVSTLLFVMDSSISQLNIQAERLVQLSYIAMILLGLIVAWKGIKQYRSSQKKLNLVNIGPRLTGQELKTNTVPFTPLLSPHNNDCECGHSHVASSASLTEASNLKDYFAIVVSIGMRPCSGALMALIFAKSLNVYWLGVVSALSMGLGTAIAIGLLAWLSLSGGGLAKRYVSLTGQKYRVLRLGVKLAAAGLICLVGLVMLKSQSLLFSPIL
ncbi:nickel/cobalt transporter [Agarivorans sp. DSG3-1]|uniref:nickel/cobalt transporter n=1 Tax=Agarivorans sp. DSG3-1 TaxID=3342249 RepID=UPI00398EE746